ncbi:MAG: dihydrodipicolinate synthase family protein, partial [Rhodospirillales bacterium]|nr:dihydrodipicolinate synthase family protein [Rhodospirillales bacterium]
SRLYGICVDEVKGRVPVVAGTGAIRTEDVIALSQSAKDAGCDGVMILPPFFVKPTTDDIIAHYQAVSDAVSIPIMLYNLPQHAVNELTPALVARLCAVPNVVAIKDSTDDFAAFYRMLTLAGESIRVFTGQQTKYGLAAVELGAVGTVASMPNYWGRAFAEFFDACRTADLMRARAFQAEATALTELITGDGRNLYCGTKAAMNILGLPGGDPRLPLRPLGEPHLAALRAGLERHGLLATTTAAAQ